MNYNREDLAWAAGFYDGEGCSTINKQKGRTYIRVSISQKDTSTLIKFQRIVQLGTIYPGYISKLQIYTYETVQQLTCLLWPWLGTVKKQQFSTNLKTFLIEYQVFGWTRGHGYIPPCPSLTKYTTKTCLCNDCHEHYKDYQRAYKRRNSLNPTPEKWKID